MGCIAAEWFLLQGTPHFPFEEVINSCLQFEYISYLCRPLFSYTEALAQLVRASDCGSEGRGFETHMPPF